MLDLPQAVVGCPGFSPSASGYGFAGNLRSSLGLAQKRADTGSEFEMFGEAGQPHTVQSRK